MHDLQLLEKAARAASLPWDQWVIDGNDKWNPLLSNDDALGLLAKLCMEVSCDSIEQHMAFVYARVAGSDASFLYEPIVDDPCAALRRVIVRVAAEGKEAKRPASARSPTEQDLGMMVRRLASALRRISMYGEMPAGNLPELAMALLKKHGLHGSTLRQSP